MLLKRDFDLNHVKQTNQFENHIVRILVSVLISEFISELTSKICDISKLTSEIREKNSKIRNEYNVCGFDLGLPVKTQTSQIETKTHNTNEQQCNKQCGNSILNDQMIKKEIKLKHWIDNRYEQFVCPVKEAHAVFLFVRKPDRKPSRIPVGKYVNLMYKN